MYGEGWVWGGLCVSEIVYTVHVFVTFYRFRVMPNLWPMIETTSNSSMSKSASIVLIKNIVPYIHD